ncbi:MAG: hypothetical protein ABF449_02630 [Ethanoligenens sp.]
MIVIPIISLLLLIAAIILFFNLTPERITNDMMKVLSPKQSLRDKVRTAQGKKKSLRLTTILNHLRDAMDAMGKGAQFTVICAASIALMITGGFAAVMLDNYFLIPVLAVALPMIPFIYARTAVHYYESHIKSEIETALSVITTSYIRSFDIVSAVRENISYLKPPVDGIFKSFLGEATAINSDIKQALYRLKNKIGNNIFKEWVETLIQCQDDRTLNDTLLPVVAKLADVRIVNNDLKTMLAEPKKEYFTMVTMLIGSIPLLYLLNKDWYATLMFSLPGKIMLAVCGAVILITALLMAKYTKPIEYRR